MERDPKGFSDMDIILLAQQIYAAKMSNPVLAESLLKDAGQRAHAQDAIESAKVFFIKWKEAQRG